MSPTVGPRFAPPVPEGYALLTGFEQEIAKAISLTIFPEGGEIGPSGEDVGVSRFFDRYLAEIPPLMRTGLRVFLIVLEFLPFLFIFKLSRFSRLNASDRERYLEAWYDHRFFWMRAAMLALKSICSLCYYADERVREELGFYVVCVDGKRRQDI